MIKRIRLGNRLIAFINHSLHSVKPDNLPYIHVARQLVQKHKELIIESQAPHQVPNR